MQTFLPYPEFNKSAHVLDRARLGKQRIETKQLVNALLRGGGWSNHPAAKMWRGHEYQLCLYGMSVCVEWTNRGYVDNQFEWFEAQIAAMPDNTNMREPKWLGDPAFHAAHRSNLLRKSPEHYGQFGWQEPPDLPYVWPVS